MDKNVVGAPRVVEDSRTGDMITVKERRADRTAGARGTTCLIFSTERGFTRLWDYPADWASLSDADIVSLSEFRRSARNA